MRVLVHLDLQRRLKRSGIYTAYSQHRRALEGCDGVELVEGGGNLARLSRTFRRQGPDIDIAHTHLFGPSSLVLAAMAKRHDIPLVCHAHVTKEDFRDSFRGSNQLALPLGAYLKRWYSRGDLVICPSEYTKRRLEAYPVTAPIEAVSNGIDLESLDGFESLRETYRDRYDLEGTVVFCLGNVFERKGVDTFIEVAKRCPELEFVWFGPYDTGLSASQTVKEAVTNPPPNVTFTGWIEDKRGGLAAGDIFLLPSHEENQGIAVLEAMACGKPVVLRDLPVFHEYASDGEDCRMANDVDEFVAVIQRLVANPKEADALGEAANETAQEHRLEVVGERLLEHYRQLIDG